MNVARAAVNESPGTKLVGAWLEPLVKPDLVYSSPFTRAIETAVIGLRDVLPEDRVVLMREAREQKNFGGADSSGVAMGDAICTRVEEDLRGLYEASCRPEEAEVAVKSFQGVTLDTSNVRDEWWGPLTGDAPSDLLIRIEAFVKRLRLTRGGAAGTGGGSAIVVGHSLFLRTLFQTLIVPRPGPTPPAAGDIALSLRTELLPYCAVIGTVIEWNPKGWARIVEVAPLLGTKLAPAEFDEWRGGGDAHVAGCVCGRGKGSCAIA